MRALREAVRHRAKLVALRSGLKAQVHPVLAKQGGAVAVSDLFGVGGQQLLDRLELDPPSRPGDFVDTNANDVRPVAVATGTPGDAVVGGNVPDGVGITRR